MRLPKLTLPFVAAALLGCDSDVTTVPTFYEFEPATMAATVSSINSLIGHAVIDNYAGIGSRVDDAIMRYHGDHGTPGTDFILSAFSRFLDWNVSTGRYEFTEETRRSDKALIVRLYELDSEGIPVEPLNRIGDARLSILGSGRNSIARLEVFQGTGLSDRVFDLRMQIALPASGVGVVSSRVTGFFRNSQDSVAFRMDEGSLGSSPDSILSVFTVHAPTRGVRADFTKVHEDLPWLGLTGEPRPIPEISIHGNIATTSGAIELLGDVSPETSSPIILGVNGESRAVLEVMGWSPTAEVSMDGVPPLLPEEVNAFSEAFKLLSGTDSKIRQILGTFLAFQHFLLNS